MNQLKQEEEHKQEHQQEEEEHKQEQAQHKLEQKKEELLLEKVLAYVASIINHEEVNLLSSFLT